MRETESCLNRLDGSERQCGACERRTVKERSTVNKISVHRHDVSPIESDLLSCGRAIDSHGNHVTAAVACGISICYTVVPRRARCVGFADDRERSTGGLIPRAAIAAGFRGRGVRAVECVAPSVCGRVRSSGARARARTRGSNFAMSHPIDRSGRAARWGPQGLGRTCAGAGGSPVVGTCMRVIRGCE